MTSAVTVHVSDTATGRPAVGLRMQVYWSEASGDVLLRAASTNADGTTATPMVAGAKLSAGVYKLVLHVGDYAQHAWPEAARCLDVVPVVFTVDDATAGRRVDVTVGPAEYAVRCV